MNSISMNTTAASLTVSCGNVVKGTIKNDGIPVNFNGITYTLTNGTLNISSTSEKKLKSIKAFFEYSNAQYTNTKGKVTWLKSATKLSDRFNVPNKEEFKSIYRESKWKNSIVDEKPVRKTLKETLLGKHQGTREKVNEKPVRNKTLKETLKESRSYKGMDDNKFDEIFDRFSNKEKSLIDFKDKSLIEFFYYLSDKNKYTEANDRLNKLKASDDNEVAKMAKKVLKGIEGIEGIDIHEVLKGIAIHEVEKEPHEVLKGIAIHEVEKEPHEVLKGIAIHEVEKEPHEVEKEPHEVEKEPHEVEKEPHEVENEPLNPDRKNKFCTEYEDGSSGKSIDRLLNWAEVNFLKF